MTRIEFVVEDDPKSRLPEIVTAAGLCCRFAVIQHTYRADKVDMYFDELLWRRLVECVSQLGGNNLDVRIVRSVGDVEVSLDSFMRAWSALEDSDKEPPQLVLARKGQELVLCIATEYWTRIGGPRPYADSYTYWICSKENASTRVRNYLAEAEAAGDWELAALESKSLF